ncbi:MAG: hypothetical protein JWN98_434 [Abditibacteriota bacterium]|nr:hypothetical protein [Abditibacteriota bacterium]
MAGEERRFHLCAGAGAGAQPIAVVSPASSGLPHDAGVDYGSSLVLPLSRLGCKVLSTRFGGAETYRKTTPAFLGLALGDIAMILFWLLPGGWQGRTMHHLTSD